MKDYIFQEKIIRRNSILFGMALMMNFISGAISDYIVIDNIFPLGMFCLFLLSFFNNIFKIKKSFRVSLKMILFVAFFLMQLILSFLGKQYIITLYYTQCFFLIGISSLYLSRNDIIIRVVRHTVIMISCLCITHFLAILSNEYTVYTAGEQMGNAYSILIILFIAFWTMFDSNDKIMWKLISAFEILLCLLILTKVMTRGVWLCIFIYLCFFGYKKIKNKKIMIFIFLIFPFVIFFAFFYLMPFLANTNWFFNMFVLKSGGILNGRENLIGNILEEKKIFQVFFGSGIGGYYQKYLTYPHNLFAQLYYDQGLVSLIFIFMIAFFDIKKIIKSALKGSQFDYLIIIIFCAGVIKLMVSSYFWIEQLFWIFMGLGISRNKISRRRILNE